MPCTASCAPPVAQQAGKFNDEIIPVTVKMAVVDRETKEVSYREVTVNRDECNRPDTTLEGLASSNQYGRVASLLLATPASCRMVPPPSW